MEASAPLQNVLTVRTLGIDTYRENIVYIRADSNICKSEGFSALTRLVVKSTAGTITATLNVVESDILHHNEAGLSKEAMRRLAVNSGDTIEVQHLKPIESFSRVRAKMFGKQLTSEDFLEVIRDVVAGHYSNIQLASFITACSGERMSVDEIGYLTNAMLSTSEHLHWENGPILDKHSVGGLPGNRTTPIVVSIVASAGLTIPKTSSRAITSPAGTADAIETFTTVDCHPLKLKEIVSREGGCFVWGGAVNLSPADDILISVERSLDIDSSAQMVASVISKKAAAGSTHVLIEVPVGETAKVRSQDEALRLQYYFKAVAEKFGLHVEVITTEGSQPVGRGIGPSLEARDVLSVLRGDADAPADLREKSIVLAGRLLEMSGRYEAGSGIVAARKILEGGDAYKKFLRICEAQGGFHEPRKAAFSAEMKSTKTGTVKRIDNRKLARIAKLAGAPKSPSAGVLFAAPLGKKILAGDVLYTIYSDSAGELRYAQDYASGEEKVIWVE